MATQSTVAGRNAQGVINSQDPANGVFEIDLQIVSTLTTALQIELFNPERSQFVTANPAINNYVPPAAFYLGTSDIAQGLAAIPLAGATANEFMSGVIVGSQDIYVNGAGFPPTGATKNVCYIDVNGNAIYQPGYAAGAQVAGNVTITATQQNVSYKHILDWAKNNVMDFHSAKIEYSENGQIANPLLFKRNDIFGSDDTIQINPKNAKSEDQYNPLLLTPALKQRMTPNRGIRYNMSAATINAGVQTVTMNIFMSIYNRATGKYALNAD